MRDFFRYLNLYTKKFTRYLKRFLPDRLFWRAVLILIGAVCIVQATVIAVFFEKHISEQIIIQSANISGEISAIRLLIEKHHFPEADLQKVTENFRSDYHFNRDVNQAAQSRSCEKNFVTRKSEKIFQHRLNRKLLICHQIDSDDYRLYLPLTQGELVVDIQKSALLGPKWHFLLVWTGAVSVLAVLIGIIFIKNQMRPVRKLALAAEAFGKGDYQYPYSPSGAAEIRAAGEAFIKMRDRVTAHIRQRTMLLAGVSHDLRTLLTRFSFGLSLHPLSEEDVKELKSDVRTMNGILNEYLKFAESAQTQGDVTTEIQPSAYLSKIIEDFDDKNFQVSLEIGKKLQSVAALSLEKQAFERCLINILDNARKFSQQAFVSADLEDHFLRVTVEDNGPGVNPAYYEDIFKPFFKAEQSPALNKNGTGLGLAVCKDLANATGGDIIPSKSERLQGLKITLKWALSSKSNF